VPVPQGVEVRVLSRAPAKKIQGHLAPAFASTYAKASADKKATAGRQFG